MAFILIDWRVFFFGGGFVCVCLGFIFISICLFLLFRFFKTMVAWRNVWLCIISLRYSYSARSRDEASDCF